MNTVGTLAKQIIDTEFYGDTYALPLCSVSGWLDANVGQLNVLLSTSIDIDSTGNFDPELCRDEESIYTQMFLVNYYEKAARNTLRHYTYRQQESVNDSGSQGVLSEEWTMIKEGDTVIQRSSRGEIAKSFRQFGKDADEKLRDLVFKYQIARCGPHQVSGSEYAY